MLEVRVEREADIEAIHRVNVLAFGQEDEARIVNRMQGRGWR